MRLLVVDAPPRDETHARSTSISGVVFAHDLRQVHVGPPPFGGIACRKPSRVVLEEPGCCGGIDVRRNHHQALEREGVAVGRDKAIEMRHRRRFAGAHNATVTD